MASDVEPAPPSAAGERLANLRRLREYELSRVLPELAEHSRVLEIGAGTGFQARRLADAGHEVIAVDIKPPPSSEQEYPVMTFDGRHLPFEDGSFDAVFSSNVLEHVEDLPALLSETARVLRSKSIAVHILPSASWRLWTSLVHYPFMMKRLAERLRSPSGAPDRHVVTPEQSAHGLRLVKIVAAERHGAHGNALSEVFSFRRSAWRRLLSRRPFEVSAEYPLGIFYSGYGLCGIRLSLGARRMLSRILGSSTHVLVLRKCSIGPQDS